MDWRAVRKVGNKVRIDMHSHVHVITCTPFSLSDMGLRMSSYMSENG